MAYVPGQDDDVKAPVERFLKGVGGGVADIARGIGRGVSSGWQSAIWDTGGEAGQAAPSGNFFSNLKPLSGSGFDAATDAYLKGAYGATYNPSTETWNYAADPFMTKAVSDLEGYYRGLDVAGARRAIESKYQNAAEMARRRAAIFGEEGAQTAAGVSGAYTQAGEDIANLAQAGGTAVSGLTGPAQGFQSLYGTLPGMGTTLGQDITGQTGFEQENLEDIARAALRSGTQQGKNLADFIANLSGEQFYMLNRQLAARNESRYMNAQAEMRYAKQQDDAAFGETTGLYAGLWSRGGKTQKELKYHLGIKDDKELLPALNKYREQYGTAALGNLANYITMMGGVGQG